VRDKGYEAGLLNAAEYKTFQTKRTAIETELKKLEETRVTPTGNLNNLLKNLGLDDIKKTITLKELLRRPGAYLSTIYRLMGWQEVPAPEVAGQVEIMIKYEGYIRQQQEQVERFKKMEDIKIPSYISFDEIHGLSKEVKEKLTSIRPESIGQAARVSGITPAAVSILMVHLKKEGHI